MKSVFIPYLRGKRPALTTVAVLAVSGKNLGGKSLTNLGFDRWKNIHLALLAAGLLVGNGSAQAAGICLEESVTRTGLNDVATYQSNNGKGLCGFPAGLNTSNSSATTPNPLPLGLTSGSLNLVLNSTTFGTSSASLENGTLRNVNNSNVSPPTFSSGLSAFGDVVRFKLTNGAPSAPVGIHVHEDGAWNGIGSLRNDLQLSFAGEFSFFSQEPPFPGEPFSMTFGGSGANVQSSWGSYRFTNQSPTGFDFDGIFNATNDQNVPLYMSLRTDCQLGAVCDFGNTSRLSLTLPSNVTFTSDSGVLLSSAGAPTGAVPEPATFGLLSLALLGCGCAKVAKTRNTRAL